MVCPHGEQGNDDGEMELVVEGILAVQNLLHPSLHISLLCTPGAAAPWFPSFQFYSLLHLILVHYYLHINLVLVSCGVYCPGTKATSMIWNGCTWAEWFQLLLMSNE